MNQQDVYVLHEQLNPYTMVHLNSFQANFRIDHFLLRERLASTYISFDINQKDPEHLFFSPRSKLAITSHFLLHWIHARLGTTYIKE